MVRSMCAILRASPHLGCQPAILSYWSDALTSWPIINFEYFINEKYTVPRILHWIIYPALISLPLSDAIKAHKTLLVLVLIHTSREISKDNRMATTC